MTHRDDPGQEELVDVHRGWVGQVEDEREAKTVRTLEEVLVICMQDKHTLMAGLL